MTELRRNEFKDLLEINNLLFIEQIAFIKADIPNLGTVTYYPKSNRLQINKGNEWKDDGFNFIKFIISDKNGN
jgi:hypothetical protein